MTPGTDDRGDTPPTDRLDALLRDWRRRQDARADAAVLASRIVAAIRVDAPPASPAARMQPRGRWAERTAWFTAGIAAAVAAAVLLRPAGRDGAADWPPSVRFAAGQVAEKAALVAGMEETFDGGLAWIVEHDRRVDVGLVPDAPPPRGTPLAMRIVVLSRREGETAWQPLWQSDIVARDEQVVDVAAGPTGAGRLRLWTHPLPDGAIAVDGDLALADVAVPLRVSYSGVQRPGEPQRVMGDRTNGVEWQVIQTVVPLAPARKDMG